MRYPLIVKERDNEQGNETMNNHETFGQKVLDILEERIDWDKETVIKIAKLAESLGLAIEADDGEFEIV